MLFRNQKIMVNVMKSVKSLAFAASLLTATPNAHTQWVDTRVDETKKAIATLLKSLWDDKGQYGTAKSVFKTDLQSIDKGLTPENTATTLAHVEKLIEAWIAKDAAQAVKDALNGNNTTNNGEQQGVQTEVGAGPVPVVKKISPLNETKEQKEIRLANEKAHKMAVSSAKTLRTNFLESKMWKPEPGNKLKFIVKPWRGIKFYGDDKDLELTHEAKINFTTVIAPWVYDIKIPSNDDANAVSLYLRSGAGQPIAMSGNPVPEWGTKCAANFASDQKVRIKIPASCKIAQFQITLSGNNKIFHTDDIEVEALEEENLVVNK